MYGSLDRQCTVNGIEYEVVQVLDNDLLLIVERDKFLNGIFPLQTFIVKDEWYLKEIEKMEK